MTTKPLRGCAHRRCPNLTERQYCPTHEREYDAAKQRGDPRKTHHWRTVIRPAVLGRDGYRCTKCSRGQDELRRGEKLEIHHVAGDRQDCRLEALITVCSPCHVKAQTELRMSGLKRRRRGDLPPWMLDSA